MNMNFYINKPELKSIPTSEKNGCENKEKLRLRIKKKIENWT